MPATEAIPVGPAERLPRDLAGLADWELAEIVRSQPPASKRRDAAFELLVSRYRYLIQSCVQRYKRGPEPVEDLMQVGYVGLVKAISNFDPAVGSSLNAYARPYISGEIKRHFRDTRWQIHVTRSVQELILEVRQVSGQLAQELGRTPDESDLARHLGVSGAALREARGAEMAFRPGSLDAPIDGQAGLGSLADLLGEEDPRMEHMLGMQAVAAHWRELHPRERKILLMRFYGEMTQTEIGQQLGLSQMHVSRLITGALGYLRPRLTGQLDGPYGPRSAGAPVLQQVP